MKRPWSIYALTVLIAVTLFISGGDLLGYATMGETGGALGCGIRILILVSGAFLLWQGGSKWGWGLLLGFSLFIIGLNLVLPPQTWKTTWVWDYYAEEWVPYYTLGTDYALLSLALLFPVLFIVLLVLEPTRKWCGWD